MTRAFTPAEKQRGNATKMRDRARILTDLSEVKRKLAAAHLQQAEVMEDDARRLVARAEALEDQ